MSKEPILENLKDRHPVIFVPSLRGIGEPRGIYNFYSLSQAAKMQARKGNK